MLGEKYLLLNEFLEFNELIYSFVKIDVYFKKMM